ncbi:glycosyltransferase family 9 protein, partial [Caballeronia glebae]|uniref:glycosyltransferase family 9 protein n=2 Tax=Caballeronia glebae TaxID=1777143 RepID=UPI0038B900E9
PLNGGLLRHPKLYAHDDSDIVPHKVVVHTTGSDRRLRGESRFWPDLEEDHIRVMSDDVIAALRRNYRNWMIVRIGAEDDKLIEADNVIDLRGKLDLWETAAEIASASRFIGVNSGPMHIANCYPRVSKRIVLMESSQNYLQNRGSKLAFPFRAGDVRNLLTSWLDPANTYFNRFGHDLGITSSFSKV